MQEEALPKAYDHKLVEEKQYTFWETEGFFKADPNSAKPAFSIVMPPPNITGNLHMGHALDNAIQDCLIRFKRMSGFETLWVPGTDHAGIATQTVVEKQLMAKTGKRRKDHTREEFLSHVWDWKKSNQEAILNQIRKMGSSCDWSRLCFTMDEEPCRSVKAMFKKMFDEGLIYLGDYLVNWDPVTQTALADDEVEHEEKHSFLWYIRYPLTDGSASVTIATTRPETMLGDSAVAVNPEDHRFTHLVGKTITLPITGRIIPIIADRLIDPAFGTGCVKITPAHDPNDYQMGFTHHLSFINIMTPDGKINEQGAPFTNLTMEDARLAVIEKLKELDCFVKAEPHTHRVGVSYRSKAVIEPYMSKQWFIKMDSFKVTLRKLLDDNKIHIIPNNWESTYIHWVDNLRDWCISRQLWWGHRIPIWYNIHDPKQMVCEGPDGPPSEVTQNPSLWRQEEDVLDTWFSSGLWPFSTLGWPNSTDDLKKFYPNSALITGHDILFFWVARMLFMGEYALGTAPFPDIFLHGLIYGKSYWRENAHGGVTYASPEEKAAYDLGKPTPPDIFTKWEKMSKSKGNVIDPLEIIDLYGTDAMRMALCASASHARQIDLDRRRFEDFKNFTNKIWNGSRFVFLNLEDLTLEDLSTGLDISILGLEDKWILSLLDETTHKVIEAINSYSFDKAAVAAYDFFWKEFCAYYVELVKPTLFGKAGNPEDRKNKQKILTIVLTASIRLLHPMAPFITEEIFQKLKNHFIGAETATLPKDPYMKECLEALAVKACIIAPYPHAIEQPGAASKQIQLTFELLGELVHGVRNLRTEMQVSPGQETDVYLVLAKNHPHLKTIESNQGILKALVKIGKFFIGEEVPEGLCSSAFSQDIKIMIPVPEAMREKERLRLVKEKEKLLIEELKLQEKLSNEEFVQKAPPHIYQKLSLSLEHTKRALQEIEKKLQTLN